MPIRTTHLDEGQIGLLELDRPPVNALDADLLLQLAAAVRSAACGTPRALVLTGRPGMFSAGLDLFGMLALEREGVRRTWEAFFDAARALAASPVPIVAALAGHAPAGGCVLALQCDCRVMVDRGARIGLNEVALGLPLPDPIRSAYDFVLGQRTAALHGSLGTLFEPEPALRIGLVDELAPQEQVLPLSIERARAFAALPPAALARTRREARAPLVAGLDLADNGFMDGLIEIWFSAETQAGFRAAAARLAQKKG